MRKFLILAVLFIATTTAFAQTAQSAPPSQAEKQSFLIRLLPPRPTFLKDMTPAEQKLMEQHFAYWQQILPSGKLIVGGPVLNPDAPWGLLIVEVANEAEARALGDGDPSVKAGMNKAEVQPMRVALLRGSH